MTGWRRWDERKGKIIGCGGKKREGRGKCRVIVGGEAGFLREDGDERGSVDGGWR